MSGGVAGGVPVWQPDLESTQCPICDTKFSFFYRRHHCRLCGRVVCGSCSANQCVYLPTSYVVSAPGQIYLESPLVPHRTCDDCRDELDLIRQALDQSSLTSGGLSRPANELMVQNVPHGPDELNRCPVCDRLLVQMPESEQEIHVDECLRKYSASPNTSTHPNRMIISRLPNTKEVTQNLGECTVCFEDFEPGQNVGRLECLCVFHEKCILAWFTRKGVGNCPVHNQ